MSKYTIRDWMKGLVGIEVSGEKEFRRLMDIADGNGIRWKSGTNPHDFIGPRPPFVVCCNRSTVGMTFHEGMLTNDVKFADIVPDIGKKELHITSDDGYKTFAVLKVNGKVSGRSTAFCHPDDQYDFLTGARVVLDRLQGEKLISLEDVPTGKLVEELAKRKNVERRVVNSGWGVYIGIGNSRGNAFHLLDNGPVTVLTIGIEEGKSK